MLKKDAAAKWFDDCQKAFDRIKEYLSTLPILVPLEPGRPLLLYLALLDGSFGCVLGQHDETGRKEQAIYDLSKKVAQKFRHYFCAYTTYLISRMDPWKYIFQKPMPTGKLAKWQILLSEFDIVDVIQKAIKGQALVDHVTENPVDGEIGQHYPVSAKLRFPCTNNMAEYEACILGLKRAINMNVQELIVIGDSDLLIHQGMDVIGPIEHAASNGHRFILVAIDYFTKWVEAASYKAVTKKVVEDFVCDRIVCRFGIPESIITDNGSNLMKAVCETFKIKHKNSTAYKPQMNGAVETTYKNIKKILRKMVERHKQWHEKLSFALLGYRTTIRTSIGANPYMLVYGTEAVIPVEVEIHSLRIIQEAKLDDAEWVKGRYERLALIMGKG
ncbi:uncharacterized protein [Nicotiana sylvestris]|uniref:uncharacterized protein n=1 Tax=Nicotiana sylvestris TaxID=4096 RepID=UPI00388C7B5F